ncbi:MAG: ComEA family DNA-binding protein [Clostridiaceae bacterium]|nr:ComEA family DNA-binding protein [Clostridiaceae bacterium]
MQKKEREAELQPQEKSSRKKVTLALLLTGLAVLGSLIWDLSTTKQEDSYIIQTTESNGETLSNAADVTGPSVKNPASETDPLIGTLAVNQDSIPVYLVGAVRQPGIYQIKKGTYLYQLVEQAGGLTDDAAKDRINLAMRLDANQLIRIPTQTEADNGLVPIPDESTTVGQKTCVNINQATLEQLDQLPGIGPSTAQAIIAYREKNGPFQNTEDLMKIPGIKESRYEALKDLICINGQT